jgi:hypothetical protein
MWSALTLAARAGLSHTSPFWVMTASVERREMSAVSPLATVTVMSPLATSKVQGVASASG